MHNDVNLLFQYKNGSVFAFENSAISPPLPLKHIPLNPDRLDAAHIVRFRAVHQVVDRINLQWHIQRTPQHQLVHFTARVVIFQPQPEIFRHQTSLATKSSRRTCRKCNHLFLAVRRDAEPLNRIRRAHQFAVMLKNHFRRVARFQRHLRDVLCLRHAIRNK